MLHDFLKNLSPSDITLLGSLMGIFGIIVGCASSLVNLLISRWYEDKRHFRSLAIQAALDNWRMTSQLRIEAVKIVEAQEHSQFTTPYAEWHKLAAAVRTDEIVGQPDGDIIHMLKIMEIAANTKIPAEEAAKMISKINSRPPKQESSNK